MNYLAKLLKANEQEFLIITQKMSRISQRNVSSEMLGTLYRKKTELLTDLGLDPKDTTKRELKAALKNKFKKDGLYVDDISPNSTPRSLNWVKITSDFLETLKIEPNKTVLGLENKSKTKSSDFWNKYFKVGVIFDDEIVSANIYDIAKSIEQSINSNVFLEVSLYNELVLKYQESSPFYKREER